MAPPQVTLHIGVQFSSGRDILLSARANAQLLREQGVFLPPIRKARKTIDETLRRLDGMPPIPEEQTELLTSLTGPGEVRHLVLDDDLRAGSLRDLFNGPALYNGLETRIAPTAELFSQTQFRLSLALINPAVFLDRALASGNATRTLQSFAETADPTRLSWREMVQRLRRAMPEVPLVLWCDEDAPLIWPQVMRHLFALPQGAILKARLQPLQPLLEPEGLTRLRAYLEKFPPDTHAQYERVILLFLDKYGIEDALSPRCDIPGWDSAKIAEVTARYEDDIVALAQDEGVTLILPDTPLA
jgi:hypothetical protein